VGNPGVQAPGGVCWGLQEGTSHGGAVCVSEGGTEAPRSEWSGSSQDPPGLPTAEPGFQHPGCTSGCPPCPAPGQCLGSSPAAERGDAGRFAPWGWLTSPRPTATLNPSPPAGRAQGRGRQLLVTSVRVMLCAGLTPSPNTAVEISPELSAQVPLAGV